MASVKQSLSLGVAGQRSMLLSTLAGVALALLMAVPSRADDVTFLDLTDTLSVSTSSTRISGSCDSASETCVATILAPPGSVFETTAIFGVVFIAEADGTLSDAIGVTPSTDGMSVQVAFVSDLPGIPFGPTCDTVGGCLITEDGTVQLGNVIDWVGVGALGGDTFDFINFQSDLNAPVPPVPEPASLTLLGSGFLAVVGYIRRRRAGVISAARTESNLA